ncbi:MAG: N-acetyltransferase [Polyangiaceae bacterium]|nr:N-acetyltransferase [Polyangiaceae bacterium]
MSDVTPCVVVAASAAHRACLAALFADTAHASAGCYCRFWHFEGDDNAWQARLAEPDANRVAFERDLAAGAPEAAGLVALDADGRALGWLKLAPKAVLGKLATRRPYRGVACLSGARAAESGVLVIGCALVLASERRRGVFAALVAGAVGHARRTGAHAVEAVPRRAQGPVRDEELWTGVPSVFERLGFRAVDGHEAYPVLRLELAPAGAGAEGASRA